MYVLYLLDCRLFWGQANAILNFLFKVVLRKFNLIKRLVMDKFHAMYEESSTKVLRTTTISILKYGIFRLYGYRFPESSYLKI